MSPPYLGPADSEWRGRARSTARRLGPVLVLLCDDEGAVRRKVGPTTRAPTGRRRDDGGGTGGTSGPRRARAHDSAARRGRPSGSRARRSRRSCGYLSSSISARRTGTRPRLRATRTGRREVQRAIRRYRSGGSIGSIEHLAWLAVLLADLRVRDDAWAPDGSGAPRGPLPALDDCAGRGGRLRAGASVAAGVYRMAVGNGALAAMAVDRALAADPGLLDGAAPRGRRRGRAPAVGRADANEPGRGRGELRGNPRSGKWYEPSVANGRRAPAGVGGRRGAGAASATRLGGQGTGGQRGRGSGAADLAQLRRSGRGQRGSGNVRQWPRADPVTTAR